MNSRERVRQTLQGKIPDYVPNGWGGCETAGLHVLAYQRLQKVLDRPQTPPRINTFMVNAVFEEDVITAMQGDILLMASPRMCRSDLRTAGYEKQWKLQRLWGEPFRVSVHDDFILKDDGGIRWGGMECPQGSYYFDSAKTTDLLAEYDIPDPDQYHPSQSFDESDLRKLEQTAKRLYDETEFSLCLGETLTDLQISPCGMMGTMILMKQNPEIMKAFLQKAVDAALSQLTQLHQAVGQYVDIVSIAHDFGDNRSVMIGEGLWREIYKPYYYRLFRGWHEITGMKINFHSCGAIAGILPDLIECGVDILNPVQISAKSMQADDLKGSFGGDIVFWGGAYDAQLSQGIATYDGIYEQTKENIDIFKKGGRYIFSGVHNLPASTSALHIKAILDAWRDARDYRQPSDGMK